MRTTAEVWLVVQWLKQFSSAAGPGTTLADIATPSNNLLEVFNRFCIDPRMFGEGLQRLVTVHWARLFGTTRRPNAHFGLEGGGWQGMPYAAPLLAAGMVLMATRIAVRMCVDWTQWKRCVFCVYLVLVGAMSAMVYALGRCGVIAVGTMRYDLLSIAGAVGLAGWFFAVENRRWVRAVAVVLMLVWGTVSAAAHVGIWAEYGRWRVPLTPKQQVIRMLQARGIRYIASDYWLAYYITFATNEQIIAGSTDVTRIATYNAVIDAHQAEVVHVSRQPCGDTGSVIEGVYFCRP